MKTSGNTSQTVTVLSLLDAYQEAHEEASCHWKDAMWNLTRARRSKCSGGGLMSQTDSLFSASNVRQELRPRAVLMTSDQEPTLLDDDDDDTKKKKENNTKDDVSLLLFTVEDPVEVQKQQAQRETNNDEDKTMLASESSTTSGLRHRKQAADDGNKTLPTWTVEVLEENDDEEARLRQVDPLELISGGFSPGELKVAQANARKALDGYVRAAALKQVLERHLLQGTTKQSTTTSK
jgi:hypothetical protein